MPGVGYVITGIESVDVLGVPPGNDQFQPVTVVFQVESLKVTVLPEHKYLMFETVLKYATGMHGKFPVIPVKFKFVVDQSVLLPLVPEVTDVLIRVD
jgi:hypothetical protein